MTPRLSIRVDATPGIGAGHAMRCATLAEAWKAMGGDVELVGTITQPFARARIETLGVPIRSTENKDCDIQMVDSYDAAIRASMPKGSDRLAVVVDDIGGPIPRVDVIWNPNAYAPDGLYREFKGSVIGGVRHVPIRGGLPSWTGGGAGTALTVGASAAGQRVAKWITEGLDQRWKPVVTTGQSMQGVAIADAREMWPAFSRCERLICAAGITTWEAAAVGIPTVLVVTADNQALVAGWARDGGVPVIDLRDFSTVSDRQLDDALVAAAPLPRVTPGAGRVADTLVELWKTKMRENR